MSKTILNLLEDLHGLLQILRTPSSCLGGS